MTSKSPPEATNSDPPAVEDSEDNALLGDNIVGDSQHPTMIQLYPSQVGERGQLGMESDEQLQQLHPDPLGPPAVWTNNGNNNSWELTPVSAIDPEQVQNSDQTSNLFLQSGSVFEPVLMNPENPTFAATPSAVEDTLNHDANPLAAVAGGSSTLLEASRTTGGAGDTGLPSHFSNVAGAANNMLQPQLAFPGGALMLGQPTASLAAFATAPLLTEFQQPMQHEQPEPPPNPDVAAGSREEDTTQQQQQQQQQEQQQRMIDCVFRQNAILQRQLLMLQTQSYQHGLMMLLQGQQQQQLQLPVLNPFFSLAPAGIPTLPIGLLQNGMTSLPGAVMLPGVIAAPPSLQTAGVAAASTAARRPSGGGGDQATSTTAEPGASRQVSQRRGSRVGLYYDGSSKPKRPLSAYNFFFQDERVRLLDQAEEQAELQHGAAPIREHRRRRRRRRSGVSFEDMGREIGKRWKQIDPQRKLEYQKLADEDKERYEQQLKVHEERKQEEEREEEEEEEEEGANNDNNDKT